MMKQNAAYGAIAFLMMFIAPIINPFLTPADYVVPGVQTVTAEQVDAAYVELNCGKDNGIPTSTLVLHNSELKTISFEKGWKAFESNSAKYTVLGFCYGNL
jgi:hypothetical protein